MARYRFTSRSGGVSSTPYNSFNLASHVGDELTSVLRNREILAREMGLRLSDFFFMNQVHGNNVAVIDEHSQSSDAPTADALFTMRTDVALVVLVADCIPVLLETPTAVAAVHVGRRGLAAGVIAETVKHFTRNEIANSSIKAHIGASICAVCYEVDKKVYDEVVEAVPATATTIASKNGKPCLDLNQGLYSQLEKLGIAWSATGKCTMHHDDFFSYRAAAVTGRQAGVITLKDQVV